MTAVLEARSNTALPELANGQPFVVWGDWQTYRRYRALRDELRPYLRINFDRGRIELMTLSSFHERVKYLFGRLIDIALEELRMPYRGMGQTTVSAERLERGCEPDVWYYLAERAELKRDIRQPIDFDRDPPPDLAVEIEISRSFIDRLPILATMGVAEVWRYNVDRLIILQLDSDGKYGEQPVSHFLPDLSPSEIMRVIDESDEKGDLELFIDFRERFRAKLALREV